MMPGPPGHSRPIPRLNLVVAQVATSCVAIVADIAIASTTS